MIAVIDPPTKRRFSAAHAWLTAVCLTLALIFMTSEASADEPGTPDPYQWHSVTIGGGGFVTGVLFHPAERDLAYARTDVGGAYRWDAQAQRWVALTDWLGADDWNLMGIDAFAVDPADPNALYLAAGTYMHERAGNAAVLRSFDRGKHFERADLPFKLGGNQLGRANGERLAVDPHDSRVLLLGSRDAGLWRSDDRGAHWARVETFPADALAGATARNHVGSEQAVGIAFVVFDAASGRAGAATRRIYVGVSTAQTSLYVSEDAGRTWSAVAGQPKGLRPNHMVGNNAGQWYLSYGDHPGPDLMAGGALWNYDATQGRWRQISPIPQPATGDGFGWGAVAVDPQHPQVLLASTFRRRTPRDEVFRSGDGGRSWVPLLAAAQFDHSAAPWTAHATPHWIGALAIDPFDSNHAMFVTGYGIWASRNLQTFSEQPPLQWWFRDRGLEETVPLDLLSPMAGAHLLSALGDIDGFRHDALDTAQLQYLGPRLTNGESIDAAGQAPQWVVRSGTVRDRRNNEIRALYSQDGGTHWAAFASEPPRGQGAGTIAIAADASQVVWAPEQGGVWRTADFGKQWQRVQGLPETAVVVADRVDAQRWYAADRVSGRLYESRDGAASFRDTGQQVGSPARDERARPQLRPDPWRAGVVYLASPTLGVMRWQDGQLRTLAKPDEARSLGIGKALRAGAPPALYLAGRVAGVDGLFRSDDEGAHWRRINDDAHRFGKPYSVTGDPRIPGRVYFATGGRGIFYGDPR
ncbi:cellulase [Xanthomonas campestris pv. trichodesmae]|uniref:Cellulase n=2 Tax=Xanthomonas citri TaxID=346 RepID=A0AB33CNY7_XANCI|nr:cellulase [Xanthomonas citri]ASK92591.1 cellulase [Xanthomonas citri pv. vignicola]MBV6783216.1 cellulase [Xanthomonas campestris pv. trichodesmae]MBZ3920477.1 cellulase [Xanthomonas campestris pv. trichodesmae]MBZ3923755.1 cellulase [Xanthomonas citri pv. sesbaniae]